MTWRNFFAGALASVFSVVFQPAHAAPITYAVTEFNMPSFGTPGLIDIGGSITTDGNLGSLAVSDFLDWNLIVVFQPPTSCLPSCTASIFFLTGPLSGGNSHIDPVIFSNVIATPLTLELKNASLPDFSLLRFVDNSNTNILLFFVDGPPGPELQMTLNGAVGPETLLDSFVIADGKDVPSATPLPAALPLFATGLGALGLLGWRRKRKAS